MNTRICMAWALVAASLVAGCHSAGTSTSPPSPLTLEKGVHVTGLTLAVNDVAHVPPALFGVHAMPLTSQVVRDWGIESVRTLETNPTGVPLAPGSLGPQGPIPPEIGSVLETWFDRYQPALMLTDPATWKGRLQRLGATFANAARASGQTRYLEFWNEPYINWAGKPGVNYDGDFYDQTEASEGKPMTLRGQKEPTPYLVWTRSFKAVPVDGGATDYLATRFAPANLKENDTFAFRGKQYRWVACWWGKDTSQTQYYSGLQNSLYYRQMLVELGKAIKAVDADVKLIGGWGMHVQMTGWLAWRTLYKPMIDDAAPWIDGINEHHYYGDTRMTAGAYHVVAAYARTAHGKQLGFYNSECGGMYSPNGPMNAQQAAQADPLTGARASATYFLRDVLHLIDTCPDKAITRYTHEPHKTFGGDEAAFKLLRPLRGRLVLASSDSPDLWCVASVQDNRLCVVAFNDSAQPATAPLTIDAPPGTTIASATYTDIVDAGQTVTLREQPVIGASGRRWSGEAILGPRQAGRWLFTLSAPAANAAQVQQREHIAPGVLYRVEPGQTLALDIPISKADLDSAGAATLRLVQGGWREGVKCTINGAAVPVSPRASWTWQQPMDASLLRQRNTLVFECPPGTAGVDLFMVSLLTTSRPDLRDASVAP